MALDFPDSPNDGDYYEGFVYSSSAGAWRITKPLVVGPLLEFLVCGGGGGGAAGGGGAGGFVCSVTGTGSGGGLPPYEPFNLVSGTSYSVSIGAGGAAGAVTGSSATNGSSTTFGVITALGGGGGAGDSTTGGGGVNGNSGASGGGGASWFSSGNTVGGTGTSLQGFAGGIATTVSSYSAGGGGGASGKGVDATFNTDSNNGVAGGPGVLVNITGSTVEYSKGGTGYNNPANTTSPVNTGKGGDGKAFNGAGNGFAGGSGVVILRYPATESLTIGVGLTSSTTTIGNNKVTTITAGSGTVTVA